MDFMKTPTTGKERKKKKRVQMTVFPRDLVPLEFYCLSLLYRQNHVLPTEGVPAHLKTGFDYHRVIKRLQFQESLKFVARPFKLLFDPNVLMASLLLLLLDRILFWYSWAGQGFRSRG